MKSADEFREISDNAARDQVNVAINRAEKDMRESANNGEYIYNLKLNSEEKKCINNIILELRRGGFRARQRFENSKEEIEINWEPEV